MRYEQILLLTLSCELPIILSLAFWRKKSVFWLTTASLAANLSSHGIFFMMFPEIQVYIWVKLIAFEVMIFIYEGILYCYLGRIKLFEGLSASFLANAISLSVGFIF